MNNLFYQYSGSETLLIVDDNIDILLLLENSLCKIGYDIITATNGEEAVELYKMYSGKIDLILMDIVMPLKDGIKAAAEILEHDKNAKICLMSGYVPGDDYPPDLFMIGKPFTPFKIAEVIRQRLDVD